MSTTIVKEGTMGSANQDIRTAAKANGVCLWEIADKFGVTDNYFSRMLRKEFSAENKQRAFEAIEQVRKEHEA